MTPRVRLKKEGPRSRKESKGQAGYASIKITDQEHFDNPAELGRSLQENIITVLCCDAEHGKALVGQVNPNHFEGDYRIVAERVITYWSQEGRPPGPHTWDLFADYLEDPHYKREKRYRDILQKIFMLRHTDGFNPKWVVSQLRKFAREQQLKAAVLRAAEELQRGHLPQAEGVLGAALEGAEVTTGPTLVPASHFKARRVRWYRRPFFPVGALSVLAGQKGMGKSAILIDIAARLSRHSEPRSTIFLVKEQSPEELRQMMELADGDLDRLLFFGREDKDAEEQEPNAEHQPPSRLTPAELTQLDRLIGDRRDIGLVAIEPLHSFVDPAKAHTDAGMREVLDPLAQIASRHAAMVVPSIHLTKNVEAPIRHRIMGSVAVLNASRAVNVLIDDCDDPGRKLLVALIGNYLSPNEENARGYRLRGARGVPRAVFEPKSAMFRLDEDEVNEMVLSRTETKAKGRPRKVDRAGELLKQWLGDGDVSVEELKQLARCADISWRTVKEAKSFCTVDTVGKGRTYYWRLG